MAAFSTGEQRVPKLGSVTTSLCRPFMVTAADESQLCAAERPT